MLAAFPGAEGFGAVSTGGRGGRVIKVTNLNASGPGSLAAACAEEGPRIVVFDVAGVIRGDVDIKHSRITIAGQTAPAPGITIEGRLRARPEPWTRLHDIVVRFLRIRPLPAKGHEGDAVQLPDTERVMLDHLSMAWANDETVDVIHASELTLQWSTLEESDLEGHDKGSGHNFGLLSAYPGSGNVSIHHNLFAHHARRSPSLTPYEKGKPADFRNNVVYDFREGLTHDGHVPRDTVNLVGNYYKRGPGSAWIAPFVFHPEGRYYTADNEVEGFGALRHGAGVDDTRPAWLKVRRTGVLVAKPAPVAPVATQPARDAMRHVLQRAGSVPRDRVTLRTIAEVETGTGTWGRRGPRAPADDWYLAGLRRESAPADADGDGMPDAWEDANGLDKRDSGDHAAVLAGEYTAIETYANERAAMLIEAQAKDTASAIVLLGASYVRSWQVHELHGRRTINRGVAGERTDAMRERFARDVIDARPQAVVIWGFLNDIHGAGDADVDAVLARTRENIAAMVRMAQQHAIRPVLATDVTIRAPAGVASAVAGWIGRLRGKRSYQERVNERVLQTNAWIRAFAREQGIVVLDLEPLLAEPDHVRRPAFATPDGTHISAAGYTEITAHAEEVLARTLNP
jgi:lysophospholipase L1-like esterase